MKLQVLAKIRKPQGFSKWWTGWCLKGRNRAPPIFLWSPIVRTLSAFRERPCQDGSKGSSNGNHHLCTRTPQWLANGMWNDLPMAGVICQPLGPGSHSLTPTYLKDWFCFLSAGQRVRIGAVCFGSAAATRCEAGDQNRGGGR